MPGDPQDPPGPSGTFFKKSNYFLRNALRESMDDLQRLPDCPGNPQAIQKRIYKKTSVRESKYVAHDAG